MPRPPNLPRAVLTDARFSDPGWIYERKLDALEQFIAAIVAGLFAADHLFELALALRSTGASRMVIAHTPILSGIEISHGGRLVRIDTGIF